MIVISICAVLTAIVTAMLVHPLVKAGERRMATVVAAATPVLALGLYLTLGYPDLQSAPALFERNGPRAAQRALVAEELTLMQALAEDQDNIRLMLALSDVQMKQGHLDEAVRVLERAREIAPENRDVRTQTGEAYYAQGIKAMLDGDKESAAAWMKKALAVAPKDAGFVDRLKRDLEGLGK